VPKWQRVAKKKIPAMVDVGDTSDHAHDDGTDSISFHACEKSDFNYSEPFTIMLEIVNQRKGSGSIEMIQSDISWMCLHERLAKCLDIYPASLQAQYRLSTQPKALPLNLQNENDLKAMITLVQPLIVPCLLANGRCSNRTMKMVTVQIFNRDEVAVISDKVCYREYFHVPTSHDELEG